MKVLYKIGNIKSKKKRPILAIGVFDGVHIGHQRLIKKVVKKAKKLKCKSIVITFDPHPVHVLYPGKYIPLISSVKYRLFLLKQLGIDECIILRFNQRFARLTPDKFIKKYVVNLINPREIFVGNDFKFGVDKQGTLNLFSNFGRLFGFKVSIFNTVIMKSMVEGHMGREKVSSTIIRRLITEGKFQDAKKLLGRNISILGRVVKGSSRGKKLGFPTANINLYNEVIPPLGIYAVMVVYKNKIYNGMANLGFIPTFKRRKVSLEINIFDFKKNIYNKDIIVEFIKKIRNEQKFDSIEALVNGIKKDKLIIKKFFKNAKKS